MESTTSAGAAPSWTYDVFLSFRGEDTRNHFTGHLYNYLNYKGIRTFKDDEELRRGEELSPALLKAIEVSKLYVIIFSEKYASSKWCLEELAKILECTESRKQMVFPIFYKVDPSIVRNQMDSFAEAFAKHEGNSAINKEKVMKWRTNLTQAANVSGWTFLEGDESKFIDSIVREISKQVLNRTYFDVAEYHVGIESRVRDMHILLDVGGTDVRMVGIWGIGGIGKTTIAKAIYNSIAHKFEGSCFLANIRAETMRHDGLVKLQNVLLNKILGGKEFNVTNVDEGITVIRERLRDKRVLLILDDVSKLEQLKKLVGSLELFDSGSRVIITTRHKDLLTSYQVNHIYSIKELDSHDALELFMSNAFKGNRRRYLDLDDTAKLEIDTVLYYAKGLPLALIVLGSLLCGKIINQWKDILDSQRRFPNEEIQEVLKISYNVLGYLEREVFLDIACFFKGDKRSYVIQVLNGSGIDHAIDVLMDRGLISVNENDNIWMHDLLEDMGKEIIRQESPIEPGERSRLWFHEDVQHVLTENTGTNKIKGIMVKLPKPDEICLSAGCFSNMKNLRIFINYNGHLTGNIDYLPSELRVLDWSEYPLQSLPSSFNPKKLVAFSMCGGCISTLGEIFQNLTFMNLNNCTFLTKTPNFSGLPNLVTLSLMRCTSLVEVDDSIGSLTKLATLNLRECYDLTIFPRKINFKSLEFLDLSSCRRLAYCPEFEENNESLRYLCLSGIAIKELPSSIAYLTLLEDLYLDASQNLTNLPRSFYQLQHIKRIYLRDCPKFTTFLDDKYVSLALPSLEHLDLNCCNLSATSFLGFLDCKRTLRYLNLSKGNFESLPSCISKFVQLQHLALCDCKNLLEIPRLPQRVRCLLAGGCLSLKRVSLLSDLLKGKSSQMIEYMNFRECYRLYDILARLAEKKNVLLSLSLQKSFFKVILPGGEVTNSFIYREECRKELGQKREFSFQLCHKSKIENSGLVLCASISVEEKLLKASISINEKRHHLDFLLSSKLEEGASLVLYYVPFRRYMGRAVKGNDSICPVHFGLMDSIGSSVCFNSCGSQLAMDHNEHTFVSKEVKNDNAGDEYSLENDHFTSEHEEDLENDYISKDDEELIDDYFSEDAEGSKDDYYSEHLAYDYFSENVEDLEGYFSKDDEDSKDDYFWKDGNDHEGEPLFDILARLAEKKNVLSSLSFQKSLFKVILPGGEVTNSFIYKELGQKSEFSFELSYRSEIVNSGLVLCASTEVEEKLLKANISFNEVSVNEKQHHLNFSLSSKLDEGASLVLDYVPFPHSMRWAMKGKDNICPVHFCLSDSIGRFINVESCRAHYKHIFVSKEVKDDNAGDEYSLENDHFTSEHEELGE